MKGVILPNRQAFDGLQTAILNHYYAKNPNMRGVIILWDKGINSKNSNEVLLLLDERVLDFPFSPHQVVDIDKNDSKWFKSEA